MPQSLRSSWGRDTSTWTFGSADPIFRLCLMCSFGSKKTQRLRLMSSYLQVITSQLYIRYKKAVQKELEVSHPCPIIFIPTDSRWLSSLAPTNFLTRTKESLASLLSTFHAALSSAHVPGLSWKSWGCIWWFLSVTSLFVAPSYSQRKPNENLRLAFGLSCRNSCCHGQSRRSTWSSLWTYRTSLSELLSLRNRKESSTRPWVWMRSSIAKMSSLIESTVHLLSLLLNLTLTCRQNWQSHGQDSVSEQANR